MTCTAGEGVVWWDKPESRIHCATTTVRRLSPAACSSSRNADAGFAPHKGPRS